MDSIMLTGLSFYGYHGVYEEENKTGQPFIVDVAMDVDLTVPGETDDVALTVDYSKVYEVISHIVTDKTFHLIEGLATAILKAVFASFPLVSAMTVTIHKPQAPIGGLFDDAAVTLRRKRGDFV